jgi:predicted O-methyltransferase YrrM
MLGGVTEDARTAAPTSGQTTWTAVDDYTSGLLLEPDAVLAAALAASADAGLPDIQVAPNQGRLLHLLARLAGARTVLEVGTLGGYSTIWLARALPPDGRLVSLEIDPRHAEVARRNLAAAGLEGVVEVRVGPALDSLAALAAEQAGPFDLVFIDADKANNAAYFDWAVRLGRPGTLVVVDNVVRGGAVLDAESERPDVVGTRRLLESVAGRSDVVATVLQTVGVKGHDGLAFALVTG